MSIVRLRIIIMPPRHQLRASQLRSRESSRVGRPTDKREDSTPTVPETKDSTPIVPETKDSTPVDIKPDDTKQTDIRTEDLTQVDQVIEIAPSASKIDPGAGTTPAKEPIPRTNGLIPFTIYLSNMRKASIT